MTAREAETWDVEFEESLLQLIDNVLASPQTDEAFRGFEEAYMRLLRHGEDSATAGVEHVVEGWKFFDPFPKEYTAALRKLLPQDRHYSFVDLIDLLAWAAPGEVSEEERGYGYITIKEFFVRLRGWRERYRATFGR